MKLKLDKFLSDLISTSAVSVFTVLASILVTRWLAQGLGAEEFGAYALGRRLVATALPLATVAMGVALPRYLGLHANNPRRQSSYFRDASLITISAAALIIFLGTLFSDSLSRLFFSSTGHEKLFLATLAMLGGAVIYTLVYGLYRGVGQIKVANLWQILVLGIGPLIVVYLLRETTNAAGVILALGGLYLLALVPWGYHVIKQRGSALSFRSPVTARDELIRYGLPRVPAGFALQGLLSISLFLAPYFATLEEVGYLAVGQSLFTVSRGAIRSFGVVALPRVARMKGEAREAKLAGHIRDVMTFVLQAGLFASLHLAVWADVVVLLWLGPDYRGAIPLMRVIVLAIPAYLGYVLLRSIIDAVEVRAVNTLNLFQGLALAALVGPLLASAGLGALGLASGTAAGVLLVGALSVVYLWTTYGSRPELVVRTLFLNALLASVAWGGHRWIVDAYTWTTVGIAIGIESLLVLVYLVALWRWNAGWMQQIRNRIGFGGVD